MATYTLASLFAGIGGIDLGFEKAGFKCVWANDIDPYCKVTYDANHENELICKSITEVKTEEIPSISVLAGGFPCQAFSVAGHRKGFDDERGTLFFAIIKLLKEMKDNKRLPPVVFLENVKNLLTHDNGNTFEKIKEHLKEIGYHTDEKVLNACEYGNVPQSRERIYIVGFLDEDKLEKFKAKWPGKIKLSNTLDKIIDRDAGVDDKYYYKKESTKYYPLFRESVTNVNSIYQLRRNYIRENKSGVCPTLMANMGMGGHNVPLIIDNAGRIRKLTPKECLQIQGFPKSFKIPAKLADSRVYKQIGNSVTIPVVERIAIEILSILNEQ
ncbi:MAG: DNA cytosine methyltransferase [Firmicutes bacterium]|nr:DNA cytosine methyltransferase [Bacillota bacterium]